MGTDDGPIGENDSVGDMVIPIVDAIENDVGGGERELAIAIAIGDGVKEVKEALIPKKVCRITESQENHHETTAFQLSTRQLTNKHMRSSPSPSRKPTKHKSHLLTFLATGQRNRLRRRN